MPSSFIALSFLLSLPLLSTVDFNDKEIPLMTAAANFSPSSFFVIDSTLNFDPNNTEFVFMSNRHARFIPMGVYMQIHSHKKIEPPTCLNDVLKTKERPAPLPFLDSSPQCPSDVTCTIIIYFDAMEIDIDWEHCRDNRGPSKRHINYPDQDTLFIRILSIGHSRYIEIDTGSEAQRLTISPGIRQFSKVHFLTIHGTKPPTLVVRPFFTPLTESTDVGHTDMGTYFITVYSSTIISAVLIVLFFNVVLFLWIGGRLPGCLSALLGPETQGPAEKMNELGDSCKTVELPSMSGGDPDFAVDDSRQPVVPQNVTNDVVA